MTDDLISRMDAVQATRVGPSDEWSRATKDGYELAATDCMMNILKIPPADRIRQLEVDAREAALVQRLDEARGVIEGLQINLAASISELDLWCIEVNGEGYNSPDSNNALDAARAWLAGGAA
jgi:hypothetical protein